MDMLSNFSNKKRTKTVLNVYIVHYYSGLIEVVG